MKYRLNFVSNSSSQAHIVLFPRVPESPEDVREILGKINISEHDSKMIHAGILDQHPTNIGQIIKELIDNAYGNLYEFAKWKPDQTKLERAKTQAIFHSKCMDFVSKIFKELTEIKGDGVYYIFEYDDAMDDLKYHNGDIFDHVFSLSISHH